MAKDSQATASNRPKKGPVARFFILLGRIFVFLLTTLLIVSAFLFAVCGIVTRGPSSEARRLFVLSTNETSALKFLPYWFLPDETVDEILHPQKKPAKEYDSFLEIGYEPADGAEPEPEDEQLVHIDEEAVSDELEVLDIRKPTFKGKMLIVHDPSRVIVGTLDHWGDYGLYLKDFVIKFDAVAGTNAGSFEDPGGMGTGGTPDGLVMKDGAISYGSTGTWYNGVLGFDRNYVLHVGGMTGQTALDLGLVTAVSFPPGPTLIKDGVKQTGLGGGVNPRTCVGQRADGAVLIAVIEGRHPDSIGATYDDLADLMEEYGAVNADNLDGGSSSAMIYEGEQITKGSNLIGARPLATAILVLREGAGN